MKDNIGKISIEDNLSQNQKGNIECKAWKTTKERKKFKCKHNTEKESYIKINTKMNALIWNLRSINTDKTFTRLATLPKKHQFCFLGLMEPFQEGHNIYDYKRSSGIQGIHLARYTHLWIQQ